MRTNKIVYQVLLAALGLVAPVAVVAPAVSAPAVSSSSREPELCLGQVPTIVGVPGESLSGTDGPDVLVIDAPLGRVYTGAGDDLVCFASGGAVYTGAGDDQVDASASTGEPFIFTVLGRGSDQYVGSVFADQVTAGDDHGHDTAIDVITTGGGNDWVFTDGGADVVDLGSRGDHLEVRGDIAGAVFIGGLGQDWLGIDLKRVDGIHSWTFDNVAERIARDAEPYARSESFQRFDLAARGALTFLGSDLDESLGFKTLFGHGVLWRPPQPIDVRMGGGDDLLNFYGGASGGRLDGGQGMDKIAYQVATTAHRTVALDLSSGMLRDITAWGKTSTRRAVNLENATVRNSNGKVVITGTSGPNRLKMVGDDAATIFGLAGRDALIGAYDDDVLIGGPGLDKANGGPATDRCEAEVQTGCEQ
jgi:hypothetical protein